jgi:tetratricopeptide (TPR) repeat protein
MLAAAHDYEAAERMFRRALEGWERAHGPQHPGALLAKGNLAGNQIDLGRPEEGLRLYREVYQTRVELLGQTHPETIRTRMNIGHALEALGKPQEAMAEDLAAWEQAIDALGPEHPDTLTVAANLADLYASHGWPEGDTEATRRRMEAMVASLRAIAREPSATAAQLNSAAWILLTIEPEAWRDPVAALAAAERACTIERAAGPDGGVGASLWEYLDSLALARAATGDFAGAHQAQAEAVRLIPAGGEEYRAEMEQRLREYEAGG